MGDNEMTTDAQKRASKKYYLKNKDYYFEKSRENSKKVRLERNEYKTRIDKAIEELKTANVDIDSVRLCEIIEYAIYILQGDSNDN